MNHWPVYSEQFAPLRPDCNSVAAEEISGDAAESGTCKVTLATNKKL